ncbi:MAG TPA: class I SAM-dependent methyltransferase [Candidatus Limnocylindrales bacterium]|nr:class I SAM-dependent methyltransferase [Candidatus Limnocylindrales bacterium]
MNTRAHYGFDLPSAALALAVTAVCLLVLTVAVAIGVDGWWWLFPLAYALAFAFSCASLVYTARRGRFAVWRRLLEGMRLTGRERIVDLGCGRGAVLILAARKVPLGHAIGVDRENRLRRTVGNAEAEQVKVDLLPADLKNLENLPIDSASIDLVVSSLALHHIAEEAERARVITEAVRILRPGGRVVIADLRHVPAYAAQLTEMRLKNVIITDLGWRFWHGGPWAHTRAVSATR